MTYYCKGSGMLAALASDGMPPLVDCFECGARGLAAITKRNGFGKIPEHEERAQRSLGVRATPPDLAVRGRAVTPEQKRAVMDRILAAWLAHPDLRLGQLLTVACEHRAPPLPLFAVEDERLAEMVEEVKP